MKNKKNGRVAQQKWYISKGHCLWRCCYVFNSFMHKFECLPLVKNVPVRLEAFRVLIDGHNSGDLSAPFKEYCTIKSSVKGDINSALLNLIDKVKLHASVDTYAGFGAFGGLSYTKPISQWQFYGIARQRMQARKSVWMLV